MMKSQVGVKRLLLQLQIILTLLASLALMACRHADEENVLLDYALSPDGDTLAVYSNRGIYFYDLATMDKSSFMEFENTDYSSISSGAIAFSQDGKQIAISGKFADEPVIIWDINSQKQISTISSLLSGYFVTEIEFSPNTQSIVVRNTRTNAEYCQGLGEDKLILYSMNENSKIFEADKCVNYPPIQFLFTKDEKLFLYFGTMSPEYTVYFINSNTGKTITEDCKWDQNGAFFGSSPEASIHLLSDCVSNEVMDDIEGKVVLFLNQQSFVTKNYLSSRGVNMWEFWENGNFKCIYQGIDLDPKIKPSANKEVFALVDSYLVEPNVYKQELQVWDVSTCEVISTLQFD